MVLVIAGPTSAGKTTAALEVAERFDAVVLSADAMQVYRGLDIGTGKATAEEQARVPHYGIDLVEVDESFDAGDFVALSDHVIARHERVVVAGGTSLYLRSLLRGLVQTPPVDPELRARIEAEGDLHARLMVVDPTLAQRVHPNDTVRLVRGLEVHAQTGQQLSELQEAHARAPDRVAHRALWLDRSDLAERIDARVLQMMEAGYVDEVRNVLDAGHARTLKPLQSLGYRHLCDHLLDGLELKEAVRRTQRDTRHFARKQRTWMRGLGFERVEAGHQQRALALAAEVFGDL
ncbi:MAG: tRNA (adenosine(37)-N6)-dimethylallyltransferase MiaA [Myxococcales bacterium]|nr:tRNA (adenosine(37)-N6)-dimethylallyltransferase MiaA [Myxococcales bacterium]